MKEVGDPKYEDPHSQGPQISWKVGGGAPRPIASDFTKQIVDPRNQIRTMHNTR